MNNKSIPDLELLLDANWYNSTIINIRTLLATARLEIENTIARHCGEILLYLDSSLVVLDVFRAPDNHIIIAFGDVDDTTYFDIIELEVEPSSEQLYELIMDLH